jgi:hypothetical protein
MAAAMGEAWLNRVACDRVISGIMGIIFRARGPEPVEAEGPELVEGRVNAARR